MYHLLTLRPIGMFKFPVQLHGKNAPYLANRVITVILTASPLLRKNLTNHQSMTENLFVTLFQILGSLALFIFGMKTMSEGVQRAAGSSMRNILRAMTRNRFIGVFTGFLITAVVQSSSATTVMTVSFVNAGLLTLVESAGVMMGANVGTTITGWIVSVFGLKIQLGTYAVPMFAFGVPMLLSSRGRVKYWGEFLTGFALLFLGLEFLKDAVPVLENNPEAMAFLQNFTESGFLSRLFFVLVGAVIAMFIQSSSAAMVVTLTIAYQGWLPFEMAAAMILGENIGTTITAELAALVGNTNSKRSARIHSLFNIIGVVWMLVLMPFILPAIGNAVTKTGLDDPFLTTTDLPVALSAFHTVFNVMNLIVLIGFVPALIKLASMTIPANEDDPNLNRLKFIKAASRTPELAIVELQKETAHFGEIVGRMAGFTQQLINSTDAKEQYDLLDRLKKYEKITDDLEIELTEYVTRLSDEEITSFTSKQLRIILNISNDLERIGDLYYQIAKTIEQKINKRIYFTPDQRHNLNEMMAKVKEGFVIMVQNLQSPDYSSVDAQKALSIEKEIDALRDKLREHNLKRLGDDDYNVRSSMVYNNVFTTLEKIGDHLVNVSGHIAGKQ